MNNAEFSLSVTVALVVLGFVFMFSGDSFFTFVSMFLALFTLVDWMKEKHKLNGEKNDSR